VIKHTIIVRFIAYDTLHNGKTLRKMNKTISDS